MRPTPRKAGLKHILIDGFDIRHAAPQWCDTYTLEKGAIGMKYGYGWTIQNCTIVNSRKTPEALLNRGAAPGSLSSTAFTAISGGGRAFHQEMSHGITTAFRSYF